MHQGLAADPSALQPAALLYQLTLGQVPRWLPVPNRQCARSGLANLQIDATTASAFYTSMPHLERLFIGVQSLLLLDQVLLALAIMQAGICVGVVIQVNLHLHMEAD